MIYTTTETTPATGFTTGWVCALLCGASCVRGDDGREYDDLLQPPNDTNIYFYGRVGVYYIVVAYPPAG